VLTVNDAPIFPPPIPVDITAIQRRLSDGEESVTSLGFAVEILAPLPAQDAEGEVWFVRFTVLDLDGQPVPMDSVALHLIKTNAQELFIVKSELEPPTIDRLSWKDCGNRASCLRQLIVARIRALIAAAKARLMGVLPTGCRGRRPRPVGDRPSDPAPTEEDSFPPHRHHPMKGHHRHHKHHRPGWQRTFSRVVRFIVVPAVLGVLAGLAASAVGMLVGQVVVFMWLRYRRCHSGRRSPVAEPGSDMEKEALLVESSDADLPPYSDVDHSTVKLPADTK
jgi:hypothetical protein